MPPPLTGIRTAVRTLLRGGCAIHHGPARALAIALTFDDGPDPRWTPRILAALDAAGARATFFFLAPAIDAHPELARAVAVRHQIGTHLFTHDRESCRSLAAFDDELRRSLAVHERVLGQRPSALRFPFGEQGCIRRGDLTARSITAYHWSIDSGDSAATAPDQIVSQVVPQLKPGAIVLLHDGRGPGSTRGPGHREATIAALPAILAAAAQRHLRVDTVDGLFHKDKKPAMDGRLSPS